MLLQFLVGTLVSVINIGIHALVTIVAVGIARGAGLRQTKRPRVHLMGVMVATAVVLQVAHTLEVLVWALMYEVVQAAAPGSDALYFAFVNYTTLGYGDITPVRRPERLHTSEPTPEPPAYARPATPRPSRP